MDRSFPSLRNYWCAWLLLAAFGLSLAPTAVAQDAGPGGVAARGRIEPRDGLYAVSGPSGPIAVVSALNVELGQLVKKGEVLALLDDIALQSANVRRAEAQLANARNELNRNSKLQQRRMVASADMEALQLKVTIAEAELAQARALLERARVKSPIDGRVIAIHARDGERVGTNGIVELGRTDEMFIIAEVYETDIGRVSVGQKVRASSPALEQALTGAVERVGLKVGKMEALSTDPASRADARVVEVEIRLDDSSLAADLVNLQVEVIFEA
jgi:HlyD family secretion protein